MNTQKSAVRGMVIMVIEESADGTPILTYHTTGAAPEAMASLMGGGVKAALPTTPNKPVVLEKTDKTPPVKVVESRSTLDELRAKAKEVGIRGAHLYKDADKLSAKINEVEGKTPPVKKSEPTTPPATKDKPKSGFGKKTNNNGPVECEGHEVVEVWRKNKFGQGEPIEVMVLEKGLKMGEQTDWLLKDGKSAAGADAMLVMMEDPNLTEGLKDGWINGNRWKLPVSYMVRSLGTF